MRKEYSGGFLVFCKTADGLKCLVIYSERNKIWGFPKGHLEDGETELEAALRETEEETGIKSLKVIDGFREEDVYGTLSNRPGKKGESIEKHSVYFLAFTSSEKVNVDNKEITAYEWLDEEASVERIAFDSLRDILKKGWKKIWQVKAF
ncbi:MAG: NUDIX domain-containing protein [Candidatus Omnitrophica bacterium]|nr:NUDIX domain-containing protein [Candidatus Omnitrophota bacterium]